MPAISHDDAAAAELVRRHALVPRAGATLARTLFDAIDPDAQARRPSPLDTISLRRHLSRRSSGFLLLLTRPPSLHLHLHLGRS
jgi:hypothetical protein